MVTRTSTQGIPLDYDLPKRTVPLTGERCLLTCDRSPVVSKECLAHWHGFCCNSRQIGWLWGDSYLVEEEKRELLKRSTRRGSGERVGIVSLVEMPTWAQQAREMARRAPQEGGEKCLCPGGVVGCRSQRDIEYMRRLLKRWALEFGVKFGG